MYNYLEIVQHSTAVNVLIYHWKLLKVKVSCTVSNVKLSFYFEGTSFLFPVLLYLT